MCGECCVLGFHFGLIVEAPVTLSSISLRISSVYYWELRATDFRFCCNIQK
jgi:hypothetical protein